MKLEHIEEARDLAARLKALEKIHAAPTPRAIAVELSSELGIGLGVTEKVGFHPKDSLWKAMLWDHMEDIRYRLKMIGVEL